MKSFHLWMDSEKFDKIDLQNDSRYNLKDRSWYYTFRSPPPTITFFFDTVVELLKCDITTEVFGLNYNDLRSMPYCEFVAIRNIITSLRTEREITRSKIEQQPKG